MIFCYMENLAILAFAKKIRSVINLAMPLLSATAVLSAQHSKPQPSLTRGMPASYIVCCSEQESPPSLPTTSESI
ncbi:hypothetical protein LYSIN_03558 [Lysinibacillus sphaericus]|uniref:Uncharacterized protein n=1 Tax=Lysinibacillus sphaericus TaxID=1421 RepID=A0A2S5CVC3_LYSSH|nr:hypothetical protein LYSIN_03558 [Lysinibacillus sphaericus]